MKRLASPIRARVHERQSFSRCRSGPLSQARAARSRPLRIAARGENSVLQVFRAALVFLFRLGGLDALDFSAHEGAITLVKIGNLQQAVILKFAGGGLQSQICQIAAAFEIEVHRQEGEIVGNVDETESVIKLDAIEDR